MTSGVYMIRNTVTGKRYVGASRNVEARWRGHRAELESGKHINEGLRDDWQAHGADAFEFALLETITDAEQMSERENYYISLWRDEGLYNRTGLGGFSVHLDPSTIVLKRVTFTVSEEDVERLNTIARWRHEHDPRAASLTVRELIRETHERERQKRERSGK